MNKCLSIEFGNINDAYKFTTELNKFILSHQNKIYFKVFTPKNKDFKHKIFYIADAGSEAAELLNKLFPFVNCECPARKLNARVGGFVTDREWIL